MIHLCCLVNPYLTCDNCNEVICGEHYTSLLAKWAECRGCQRLWCDGCSDMAIEERDYCRCGCRLESSLESVG